MFFRHNWPGIFWAIFILILCGIPGSEFPVSPPIKHFDKAIHFFLYAQLSILLITGFIKQFRFRTLRYQPISSGLVISFFYGFLIEFLQNYFFIARSFDPFDLLANFCGTIFGILAFLIIYGKQIKK